MTADGTEPTGKTDEAFLASVTSENVIDADKALWAMLEQFLGIDPVGAWTMADVTHQPFEELDEEGKPTGKLLLASTAKWQRDPDEPTPTIPVTVAEELPELDSLEQAA